MGSQWRDCAVAQQTLAELVEGDFEAVSQQNLAELVEGDPGTAAQQSLAELVEGAAKPAGGVECNIIGLPTK